MTICGFDSKMEEGLLIFAEGLQRAIRSKAKRLENNLEDQLIVEADQILLLSAFLESKLKQESEMGAEDPRVLGMLGIVFLCRGILGNLGNTTELSLDFDSSIHRSAERIAAILKLFEDSYEAMPKTSPILAKMKGGWKAVLEI